MHVRDTWWLLVVGFALALGLGGVVMSDEPAAPIAAGVQCPFCRAFLTNDDFCSRCGRLARLTGTTAEHRFWGDAVYVEFARFGNLPSLEATLTSAGLTGEVVTFASGDRFEMVKGKKNITVKGKMAGTSSRKEDSYSADLTETFDAEHRLKQRLVWAKRNGDPDTHLYRIVDYKYTPDGWLDRIAFATKIYLGASDWEKHPAAWIKYSSGEAVMIRDAGTLRGIETKVRMFKRSLRGEPELGEEKVVKETVVRVGDLVDAVVPAETPSR